MAAITDRLLHALAGAAARLYGGEAVSELEHALQCADLARRSGADEELQLACLRHDVGRWARLSPASRHTLGLQGGSMSAAEVAALAGHPWLADALSLRRWDDEAKVPGKPTRTLEEWALLVRRYFD